MFVARVTGTVVATVKQENLRGSRILLVRQEDVASGDLQGEETIALDTVDSGIGDRVLVLKEGGSAKIVLGSRDAHVAQLIVGVVDEVHLDHWQPSV